MGQTYKATGINLKGSPMGESDRLLTILTREFGLIRAVVPGARKPNSQMGGRGGLFVVNELLIQKGRSLDKIAQAETLESYPGLSRDLGKLAAGQYLAEVVLCQALSEQPQEELFCLLNEHLSRIEQLPNAGEGAMSVPVLAHLTHGVYHLLALAGIAPQVQSCSITQRPLIPDFTAPDWRVGFSIAAGGTVSLPEKRRLEGPGSGPAIELPRSASHTTKFATSQSGFKAGTETRPNKNSALKSIAIGNKVAETTNNSYRTLIHPERPVKIDTQLNAVELALLQQLAEPQISWPHAGLSHLPTQNTETAWVAVERILRQYAQSQFDRSIRSAALIDSYFASLPISP